MWFHGQNISSFGALLKCLSNSNKDEQNGVQNAAQTPCGRSTKQIKAPAIISEIKVFPF